VIIINSYLLFVNVIIVKFSCNTIDTSWIIHPKLCSTSLEIIDLPHNTITVSVYDAFLLTIYCNKKKTPCVLRKKVTCNIYQRKNEGSKYCQHIKIQHLRNKYFISGEVSPWQLTLIFYAIFQNCVLLVEIRCGNAKLNIFIFYFYVTWL
jgi:hypothetical protein